MKGNVTLLLPLRPWSRRVSRLKLYMYMYMYVLPVYGHVCEIVVYSEHNINININILRPAHAQSSRLEYKFVFRWGQARRRLASVWRC